MEQRSDSAERTALGPGSKAERAAEHADPQRVYRPVYRRYLALFLVASLVVGLGYRALDRGARALVCHHDRPEGQFLAYCAEPSFGDFEHGAYYYGLEPGALAHLHAADVLVFGSSRAQLALSTGAMRRYFAERGIRPYLLGFGYYESGAFPLALVRRQKLQPKAIIVLADPFFRNRTTGLVRANEWLHWHVIPELYEYGLKAAFIKAQAPICRTWPRLCQPTAVAVDRSMADGSWSTVGFPTASHPIGPGAVVLDPSMAQSDRAFAEQFLQTTGVPRGCVILSAAPSPAINADAYVVALGRVLDLHVVLPRLNGLRSNDGNHLDAESAERWSAAFLAEAGPALTACAGPRR